MSDSPSVSKFFHGYASGFDAIYGNKHSGLTAWVNKHLRKSMRLRYEASINACQPIEGRSVLDIGCGPGHFAIHLASMGAARVVGLDFAEGMLDVARANAEKAGVAEKCEWRFGDFLEFDPGMTFDYSIVMGFMDYINDPQACVNKVLSLTDRRAVFSFPNKAGFLAWQRSIRYKFKCPLYLYSKAQLEGIFDRAVKPNGATYTIKQLQRDFFVTVDMPAAKATSPVREDAAAAS